MEPKELIEELRKKINAIDVDIVQLLNKRANIVLEIQNIKQNNLLPVYDPRREEEVYANIRTANKGPLFDKAVMEIYEKILHWMKSLEAEG